MTKQQSLIDEHNTNACIEPVYRLVGIATSLSRNHPNYLFLIISEILKSIPPT